jgi:uncharacterized RDD family membrane protein YckC
MGLGEQIDPVLTPLWSFVLSPREDGAMARRVPSPAPATVYAGFGIRTAASLIDSVLMLLITAPFPLLLVVLPSETAVLGLSTLFSALLVILFWGWKQGTPGKLLLRLRIVDADSGGEPSLRQWCLRYLGYVLSTVPLLLGFFWVLWDPRRQAWHDKLAGTVVVHAPRRDPPTTTAPTSVGNAGAGSPAPRHWP